MAEFAANNEVSATTNTTAFFANYGYHSRQNYEHSNHATTPQTKDAQKCDNTILDLQKHLQTQIKVTQDQYETCDNEHRTTA